MHNAFYPGVVCIFWSGSFMYTFCYCFTCYYLTAQLVLPGRVERSYDFREENCALSLAKCKPTHRLERNIDTALAGECEGENGAHRKSHGGKEVTPLHLSFPIFHLHTVFLRLYLMSALHLVASTMLPGACNVCSCRYTTASFKWLFKWIFIRVFLLALLSHVSFSL